MPDKGNLPLKKLANKRQRYDESKLSESPEPGTPEKISDSDSPNPMMTPDDTPVRNETSGLVSSISGRILMNDFKEIDELDVLKGELEELREKLTQCHNDLEESKFKNKLRKLVSCRRAGLKPRKKKDSKKKTKRVKKTKPRRKRKQTKKR